MDMPAGGSIAQISMHNKFQELLAMTDLDYNQDSSLFLLYLYFFFSLYTNSLKQATITTGLSQIILLFHYVMTSMLFRFSAAGGPFLLVKCSGSPKTVRKD